MSLPAPHPWMQTAIALLDVRRQDRLLACGIGADAARQLAALVGKDGRLVAALADDGPARALAALALPHVRLLASPLPPDGSFGTFDALLLAWSTGPLPPLGVHGDLARRHLRPGGRLVVDLPGADMVPEVAAAWRDLGLPDARLGALRGHADADLADALRNAGLRDVHSVLGGHLLASATPGDLVGTFAAALQLDDDEQRELTHALVRRCGSTGPLEVMVHRARVTARR